MIKSDVNQATMTPNPNEDLSAGMDGELSKEAMRFLLRRLDHDASLQQTWSNYGLARDSLRRQLPLMVSPTFASRVMLAIDKESAPVAGAKRNHWLRWSTGGAIAASVAAAALMIGQPTTNADRPSAAVGQQAGNTVAEVAPVNKIAIPASVPAWLSGNSAGMLSQRASATSDDFPVGSQPVYGSRRLSEYPLMHRYRTLSNNDGSYLLLLDPQQQAVSQNSSRRAAASVH